MKTRFYWTALLVSAALIAQAHAGGQHGGGGFAGGGGHFSAGPSRGGGVSSFRSMPMRNFGGGRMVYSGQRFSPMGMHSPAFRQPYITHQVTSGNISRGDRFTRFTNGRNHVVTNPRRDGLGAGRSRNGNSNLRSDWRNHVFAHHSADLHRDWDRRHDHWWHGHRCRFVNGEWFIYDIGFDPYDYWYPYGYPYDEYAYDYYPYGYNTGVYQGDADYYSPGAYESSDQSTDSTVAAVQEQLARQGYYRGELDGIFGPETRRAIIRYQSDHGLGATGSLNTDTLHALGVAASGE
jgi:hypothetical protein